MKNKFLSSLLISLAIFLCCFGNVSAALKNPDDGSPSQPHNPLISSTPSGGNSSQLHNPLIPSTLSGGQFLQKAVTVGIGIIFIGGTIIFFFVLLLGGIKWITSGGDKAGMESARNRITHALIGLVILFSAFAIIKLIGAIFGLDLLNLTIPTF